jgi:hypothetical protein
MSPKVTYALYTIMSCWSYTADSQKVDSPNLPGAGKGTDIGFSKTVGTWVKVQP